MYAQSLNRESTNALLLSPDAFEEGNMANISPTIKVDISVTTGVTENILLGGAYSPKEVAAYKPLFEEFLGVFTWSYSEMPRLDPSVVEHQINTWPDASPIR